jgi:hypothetical protein
MFDFRKVIVLFLVLLFSTVLYGCKKAEDYEKEGNYQKAYELYMRDMNREAQKLSAYFTKENEALESARIYSESAYKAARCSEKLGNIEEAKHLYGEAAKRQYSVAMKYEIQRRVKVPAGYKAVWIPAGYKEVWVDGHYDEVWVDGGYKEIWIDGYYDQNGNYVDGHYEKKHVDGHYERKYIEGHYTQEYVSGHYENQWVEEHYEMKTFYEVGRYNFMNINPYVEMANRELQRLNVQQQEGGSVSQNHGETNDMGQPSIDGSSEIELKRAKEKLDAAYQRWTRSGSKPAGVEYTQYMNALKDYQNLKKKYGKQDRL